MRIGLIGMGQAGGRIADLFTNFSKHTIYGKIVSFSLAINAAKSDLLGLSTIPYDDRLLIGHTEVRGHGVGLSRSTGATIATGGLHTVLDAITRRFSEYIDAFFVVVGTGGGTGSGGVPVLVRDLKENFREPVYVLAVLPSDEEGTLMASNSVDCFTELQSIADGIIAFDNNLWKKQARSLEDAYYAMNSWLLRPLFSLLGAGEAKKGNVGVKVVDAGDLIASWKGLAVMGYSTLRARTLSDKLLGLFRIRRPDSMDMLAPTVKLYSVASNALSAGALSARCNLKEAQRGLILFAGPRSEINIEGYTRARQLVEEAIGRQEVRGGDFPIDRLNEVRAVTLLSGFNDLPRLREFRERVALAKLQEKGTEGLG
jgi:cell division GTPase FtsZ